MPSYSQNGEDQIIAARLEGRAGNRDLLEVGAFHPTTFSNSRLLIEKGWGAVLVEPSPHCMVSLVKEYGEHQNVTLIQAALCADPGAAPYSWMQVTEDAVSTTERCNYDRWKDAVNYRGVVWVPNLTIEQLTNQFGGGYDFISIDAEGASADIALAMLRWPMRPAVWCVEHDGRHVELGKAFTDAGYAMIAVNGENVVFAL